MRPLLIINALLLAATSASALDLYVQPQHFTWKEQDAEDATILEESGTLLSFGVAGRQTLRPDLDWEHRGEFFLGEVDYDGSTLLGAPVRTTTAYYGIKAESDLRWSVTTADRWRTGPLGGLSTRAWLRRLDHSSRDSNGYDEAWWMVYGRLGWFAEQTGGAGPHPFAEAAFRLPLFNKARYSLTGPEGDGNVAVSPGSALSVEAALGVRTKDWQVALAYENFAFDRSEPEPLPPFEIFQPASEGRLLSLRIGVSF